jgi:hypothetical protein
MQQGVKTDRIWNNADLTDKKAQLWMAKEKAIQPANPF